MQETAVYVEQDFDDISRSISPGRNVSPDTFSAKSLVLKAKAPAAEAARTAVTLAFSSQPDDLSAFVGACVIADLTGSPERINQPELEGAMDAVLEEVARRTEMYGGVQPDVRRLLLRTRSTSAPEGRSLAADALEWFCKSGFLLLGSDGDGIVEDDAAFAVELMSSSGMACLINLDLRGVETGVALTLAAGPVVCGQEVLMPCRAVLVY